MKQKIDKWFWHDGRWWQFWYPSSGPLGGIICGIPVTALIMLMFYFV